MTLNQFTFFAAVAKHLNLTKAAQELHVSQPSISQQLKSLERHYGTRLYRRTGRGIELTDAGYLFLKNVRPLLEQANKLNLLFKPQDPIAERESLGVAGTFSTSAALLPSLLARFKKTHPRAEIEFRTTNPDRLERLLLSSGAEIGVSTHVPRSPELCWEPLRRQKLVLFVSPSHRLAKKRRVTISDILATPLIIRSNKERRGTTEGLLKHWADHGLEFKVGMRCEVPASVKEAVKRNMGVGIVFEDVVKAEAKHGEFKILKGHGLKLEGETFIFYHKTKPLSSIARKFLELLHRTRPEFKAIKTPETEMGTPKQRRDGLYVISGKRLTVSIPPY